MALDAPGDLLGRSILHMNRVVLDTNILFSALISKTGASRRLLELLDGDNFVALVTVPLVLEYEDVLKRPENLLKTGLLEHELVDRFLGDFLRHAEPVSVSYLWRPQLNDPKDEMVLEAAVNGGADWIVTHNVRDFAGVVNKFGFIVSGPWPFLRKLLKDMSYAQS